MEMEAYFKDVDTDREKYIDKNIRRDAANALPAHWAGMKLAHAEAVKLEESEYNEAISAPCRAPGSTQAQKG